MKWDFKAVRRELANQLIKWGTQSHPHGTGGELAEERRTLAQAECDFLAAEGKVTWKAILEEEVAEAFAETDPAKLRLELVQVAAVCMQWVAAIDRRVGLREISAIGQEQEEYAPEGYPAGQKQLAEQAKKRLDEHKDAADRGEKVLVDLQKRLGQAQGD